jgi:hypothetical protein
MPSRLMDVVGGRTDPWKQTKEQAEQRAALKKRVNEEAMANWSDPAWQREIAAVISTAVTYGFSSYSLFDTYVRTATVGEFDTVEVVEKRGLKVFYTARGGYIEESQLRTERYELPRDTLGYHVSEFEDKIRANFADSMEMLVSQAQMRLDAEVNRRVFTLLQTAIPPASPYYVNATTGMTKIQLDAALRGVRDAIRPDGTGPVPVTIIGRIAMIDKLSDVVTDPAALYDPEATAEIRARGRLGVYRGANVVQVINYTDDEDLPYIPANELWVFAGDVGKFAMYGGVRTKNWVENTSDYFHSRGRQDLGGLVSHPEMARRIVDGTVTP